MTVESSKRNLTKYLGIYCLLSMVSIFVLLVQASYLNLDPLHNLLWSSSDLPGIGITKIPLSFGNHFFGDFLHVITAGTRPLGDTPYYPYLPASLIVGKIFSIFSYRVAVVIYFLLFFTLFLSPLRQTDKALAFPERVLLYFFVFFNIGTLYLFDRGNIQLVVSACISMYFYCLMTLRYRLAAVFLGVAVAIKLWPVLLIFPFIRWKKYRSVLLSLVTALSLNLIPLLFFSTDRMSRWSYLKSQFLQIISFGSINSGLWHAGGKNSSIAAFYYFCTSVLKIDILFPLLLKYFVVTQIALTALLIYALLKKQLSTGEQLIVISVFLLIIPSAQYGYSLSILFPAILYKMWEIFFSKDEYSRTIDYKYLLLILSCLPISYVLAIKQPSQWIIDVNTLLTPLLLTVSFFGIALTKKVPNFRGKLNKK